MDQRISLKELGIEYITINNRQFWLSDQEDWVGRGGTCLVYRVQELVKKADGSPIMRRMILKEFYPLLSDETGLAMTREPDGSLRISEKAGGSEEYCIKSDRFLASYDIFTSLHNHPVTNNYVVQSQGLLQGNGTWYLLMDYDAAQSLESYIQTEPALYDFLYALEKSAAALAGFHSQGYLHLDLTPGNLLYFQDGYVKIMDTDSFLEKNLFLDEKMPVYLSSTEGYTAPEVLGYHGTTTDRIRLYSQGEKADIFAIGAILYRYLFGEILDITYQGALDAEKVRNQLMQYGYESNLEQAVRSKYGDCSRQGIRLIKSFLRKTLSYQSGERYADMQEVSAALKKLLEWVNPETIRIHDNFRRNPDRVYGRAGKIADLERAFASQGRQGRSRIVCIQGMGGIGKSTLAREYARIHEGSYEVIVELSAATAKEAVLKTELLSTREIEELKGYAMTDPLYFAIKTRKLAELIGKHATLLIIHDYNEQEDESFGIWKEIGGDILLTSWNDWKGSGVPCITLRTEDLSEEYAPKAAVSIFQQYYEKNAAEDGAVNWQNRLEQVLEEEQCETGELVRFLGYHPLTIKVLAMQMACTMGAEIRPSQMLTELQEQGIAEHGELQFQNEKDGMSVLNRDAYHHLELIFGTAIQRGRLGDQEKEVLRYMTLIPAESGIGVDRFAKWTGFGASAGALLAQVCRKGWIEYDSERKDILAAEAEYAAGVYRMPMAVAEVLYRQDGMVSTVENSRKIVESCESLDFDSMDTWERRELCCSQWCRLAQYVKPEEIEIYAGILSWCGFVLEETADSVEKRRKALRYKEKTLEICRKVLGENHANTAVSYNNVGMSYEEMGEREKGLEYQEKALEIRKKVLGENHADTAASYNNVGRSYWKMGEREKGLEYQEKALEIYRKVLGENHADTATSYNNVGYSYEKMGEREKGLEYKEKALEIRKKVLGENHADTASSYNNVGMSYEDMGDREKGLEYQEKALEIRKKVLGENHAVTATSYNNVGVVYWKMGDRGKGLEYQEKALEIKRKVLGEKHTATATSYNNLGWSYAQQGNYIQAVAYTEKAYQIRKVLFGEEHERTIKSKKRLAEYKKLRDAN